MQYHRVIILAKAGMGKTEEIRATAKKLRGKGVSAFFFRLESLHGDFETAFEEGTLVEFNEWLQSGEEGWFFLDSVDEAKLESLIQFRNAIKKFSNKLGNSLKRSHVYITSRPTEWEAQADFGFVLFVRRDVRTLRS